MNPVRDGAMLAGRGTGYALSFLRLFRLGRKRWKTPAGFRDIFRNAVLMEVKRTGIQLTDKEVEELIARLIELLKKVFSGDISVDVIPSVSDLLRDRRALSGFLVPLTRKGGDLSEKKKEMLKGILRNNILLQHAK